MLRLGIVDFDSSHAIEFTRRFNHAGVDGDQCVDGARVEVGCPQLQHGTALCLTFFFTAAATAGKLRQVTTIDGWTLFYRRTVL